MYGMSEDIRNLPNSLVDRGRWEEEYTVTSNGHYYNRFPSSHVMLFVERVPSNDPLRPYCTCTLIHDYHHRKKFFQSLQAQSRSHEFSMQLLLVTAIGEYSQENSRVAPRSCAFPMHDLRK